MWLKIQNMGVWVQVKGYEYQIAKTIAREIKSMNARTPKATFCLILISLVIT